MYFRQGVRGNRNLQRNRVGTFWDVCNTVRLVIFYVDLLAMFLPLYLDLFIELVEFTVLHKALFVCFETRQALCVRAMEIVRQQNTCIFVL